MFDLRIVRAFEVWVRGIELNERYRLNALSFCVAAEKLNVEETDAFIAPISLTLAFAIELYLKCVLLKSGKTKEELARKPFGHDLWAMWNMPELETQRKQAMLLAESCFQDVSQQRSAERPVPLPNTLNHHLEKLSELHGSSKVMALRYPTSREDVPEGSLLICVFERLIRAEQHGNRIVRV